MIIDSHCHLEHEPMISNLKEVIKRAVDNNVKYFLSISTTDESYDRILEIINKYANVYGTYGIHPHETKNFQTLSSEQIIKKINLSKKIIGIGETGLDFYYEHSDPKIQKKLFIEHIKAAQDLSLPLIVHTRSAEMDTYDILKLEMRNMNLKVLIHCFTGSKEFVKKLIQIGCYISVSGIITFKNSNELLDAVSSIPLERLLVETDSPYLSPSPYRGKSNEPSYILHTVKKLSEIKNVSINTIESKTTNNFINLFNIN